MDTAFSIGIGMAYLMLGVVMMIVAKIVKDLLTPYRIGEEMTEKDNPALGLTMAGYFIGVMIIFVGAALGPDAADPTLNDMLLTMAVVAGYAFGGIIALNVGRWLLDKLVLTNFSTAKEIIQDRNVGTGAVEAGNYVATALIVAGAIHGEGGGPLSAVVFFVLGQLVLALFARFYRAIIGYDLHGEIERDNVAAGAAFGFSLVAIGIIVLKGTYGDFVNWNENITWFGIYAVLGFVLLMILRKLSDGLFLPNSTIAREIAGDLNMNAAWIEGSVAVSIAVLVFVLL